MKKAKGRKARRDSVITSPPAEGESETMQLPLQIAVRNLELSASLEEDIRRHATKLEAFHDRIMACRVLVETPHRHLRAGARFNVRIDLTLPGGEVVIKRQPERDLTTAIQEAFDAAQRRVEDYARVQRGATKVLDRQDRARVSRLFPYEGYGFLTTGDGREVYFHRNSVLRGGFDRLAEGTEVRFTEESGEQGPQASTVAIVGPRRRRNAARA
jgi:cold shock CspA family protein